MKQWIEIWHTQKRMGLIVISMVKVKRLFCHSKLKLWTFFWGQGEREWHLAMIMLNTTRGYKE